MGIIMPFQKKISQSIHRVEKRLPQPRYFLRDADDEEIIGSFQAHELSIIRV